MKRVLVTGGTGLVGHGIQTALEDEDNMGDEEWFFVGTKDADLVYVDLYILYIIHQEKITMPTAPAVSNFKMLPRAL